jgi:hypothetical protein
MVTTPLTFWDIASFLLQPVLPVFFEIPTERNVLLRSFHAICGGLARQLLANAAENEERDSKSIISLLSTSTLFLARTLCSLHQSSHSRHHQGWR